MSSERVSGSINFGINRSDYRNSNGQNVWNSINVSHSSFASSLKLDSAQKYPNKIYDICTHCLERMMQLDRIKFKIGNGKIFHVDRLRIKKDNCKPRKKKEYNVIAIIYLIEKRVQQRISSSSVSRGSSNFISNVPRGDVESKNVSRRDQWGEGSFSIKDVWVRAYLIAIVRFLLGSALQTLLPRPSKGEKYPYSGFWTFRDPLWYGDLSSRAAKEIIRVRGTVGRIKKRKK